MNSTRLAVFLWSFHCLLVKGFLDCCDSEVLVCLKSHHVDRQVKPSELKNLPARKITMFTYETESISEYAVFSFAINSIYAQLKNYDLISTTSRNGFEFESRDQRWNKVKLVETIITEMNKGCNLAQDNNYLVWLDSDLIVLNLDFDLESIISKHPQADLIISADVEPLNGMVNTGCMIVRVSEWSRLFFQEWWDATDRVNGMDQHVFDLIYPRRTQSSSNEVVSKVVILPTHELNSHIPASKHQEAHHNILHLAGESAAVRTHIFKSAFEEVCRAHRVSLHIDKKTMNTAYLAPQLGLSRAVLQSIDYDAVLYEAMHSVWSAMLQCSDFPDLAVNTGAGHKHQAEEYDENSGVSCSIEMVIQLRARLRDAMQSRDLADPDSTVFKVYLSALQWALHAHTHLSAQYSTDHTVNELTPAHSTHSTYSTQTHLEHLQYVLDASFELLTVDKDPSRVQRTLTSMAATLNVIQDKFVGDSSQGPLLYYQFKYFDFLATYYALVRIPSRELDSLQQAHTTWERMSSLQHFGSGNTVSDPNRALAGVLARMAEVECRDGVHYSDMDDDGDRFERGLEQVLRSVDLTSARWLPSTVYDAVTKYITQQETIPTTQSMAYAALQSINHAQLVGVPVKILTILVQNFVLASKCARKVYEERRNYRLFDSSGDIIDTPLIDEHQLHVYTRYDHVCTVLCNMLFAMGFECVSDDRSVSVRVSSAPTSHTEEHDLHGGESIKANGTTLSTEQLAPRRTVKLKRKRSA